MERCSLRSLLVTSCSRPWEATSSCHSFTEEALSVPTRFVLSIPDTWHSSCRLSVCKEEIFWSTSQLLSLFSVPPRSVQLSSPVFGSCSFQCNDGTVICLVCKHILNCTDSVRDSHLLFAVESESLSKKDTTKSWTEMECHCKNRRIGEKDRCPKIVCQHMCTVEFSLSFRSCIWQ